MTTLNPVVMMPDESPAEIVNSLKIIADLDFEKAYGGHGVWDKNALFKVSDNILALKANVDALRRMGLSMEQIVERLFPKVPKKVLQMETVSQGEYSRKNLVEALLKMGQK